MKLAFLTGIAMSASLVLPTSALAQDKTFDFLGFRTDVAVAPVTDLAGKRCKVAQTGLSRCNIFAGAVLGRARPTDVTVTFNNAHMVKITGSAIMHTYFAVAEAFLTKYGPPTTTETKPWQNKLGMTFDNTVQTWEFADGKLELRQHGDLRDVGQFLFVSKHNLPDIPNYQPPPVNF